MSLRTQPQAAAPPGEPGSQSRGVLLGFAWFAATCLLFAAPLARFVRYALANDNASHAILIPAISLWVLYLERRRIFPAAAGKLDLRCASFFFVPAVLAAAACFLYGSRWSELNQLSLWVLALILFWAAGFAALYGYETVRRASFPLAFLVLTIPIPDFLLDKTIYFLQKGTTEISAVLFDWSGVPVLRDGFVFHLAHVNIEVARECSGIRSSLALVILAILVAHFYLRRFWRQAALVLVGLFVMILKNAIRIVTLTLLASYVDPGFLSGNLHREGGVVFFLLGLALMAPVLWWLERGEREPAEAAVASD